MNNEQGIPQTQAPMARSRKVIVAAIILIIGLGVLIFWLMGRGKVSTDDAQIAGDLVPITARVAGYVKAIYVKDNQLVHKGDILVQLDRRDLEARLQTSEADLATQRAQAAAAQSQVSLVQRTAPAGERQAGAAVGVAQAGTAVSEKQVRSAQAQARSAQSAVDAARGVVTAAQSDVVAAQAQIESAQSTVKAAQDDVVAAQAEATRTASEQTRFQQLFSGGATSRQALEAIEAANTRAQAALRAARERVSSSRSALQQATARKSGAQAVLRQARARLSSAIDAAQQAQVGVGIAQSATQQAAAQLRQAEAVQSGAQTAPQQISIGEAQRRAAVAKARQAAANVQNARLQLSYTTIRAPVDGIVSQKTVQLGQYMQPGQLLMAVVPLQNVWVVANFKETQISDMRVGQKAVVEVDSYPGLDFEGKLQSFGAATGAKFSLLPPENATGNFVKVVQRIPIKIVFTRPLPKGTVLRPGQNVIVTVYVR
ncbi:MAG: HlyD family secretion protein [Armatimonadetes bacterium]|nr:HlyD family secretion protein [Armatimonadota bacterium]